MRTYIFVSFQQIAVKLGNFAKKCKISFKVIHCFCFTVIAPAEIRARGHGAQAIYEMALRDGYVNVYRGRIMLLGQDRAGKTSLKKYLIGLPFDPGEESTVGIDPSKFEIHADRIKNWSSNSENKTLLSEVSRGVARVVAEKKYRLILTEGSDSAVESDGVSPREESKYKATGDVDNGSQINQVPKNYGKTSIKRPPLRKGQMRAEERLYYGDLPCLDALNVGILVTCR